MADMKNTQPRHKGLLGTGGLLKLKPWVTIPDAARRLSLVLDDEVTEADILRLALDGSLRLSVYFVNGSQARCGKVVGLEDVEWGEFPAEMTAMIPNLPDKEKGLPLPYILSLNIDNERYLNLSDEVRTLWGVWGLPMIGSERHDIEHVYMNLTGGPAVTLVSLEGAFVEGDDGQICQLQQSFDDNEYQSGSRASLEKLKQFIAENNIESSKAESLLNQHKEKRKEFLEYQRLKPAKENYFPAGLPEDAVFVVKTNALMEFEQKHLKAAGDETITGTGEETEVRRLQRTLAALALGLARDASKWRNGNKPNVRAIVSTSLIGVLDESGNAPHGFSDTTFTNTINAALKACQSELNR